VEAALAQMVRLVLMELQIQAVEVVVVELEVVVMAVAVSSSFVIQTHLPQLQVQQAHQQSLCLVGSVFTSGRVQARSRFNHVGLG
jgi:hypothetical protein